MGLGYSTCYSQIQTKDENHHTLYRDHFCDTTLVEILSTNFVEYSGVFFLTILAIFDITELII